MILTLLAALNGASQENFVVYEGAETSYYVADHQGSSYEWEIFVDFSPDTEGKSLVTTNFYAPPIKAPSVFTGKKQDGFILSPGKQISADVQILKCFR